MHAESYHAAWRRDSFVLGNGYGQTIHTQIKFVNHLLRTGQVANSNSNDVVGIEFTAGYSQLKSATESYNRRNVLQTGIGFQIHLEKDK